MSRAMKIINEIPSNKAGIKLFADALVMGVMNGENDPLELRAKIDAIEKIIKEVKADQAFLDAVLDQADLHPEKTFELNNVKFTKAESAKYDYSNDAIWKDLKDQEEEIAAERKDEEAMLKALHEMTIINGEQREPPIKRSTSYVRVTFG